MIPAGQTFADRLCERAARFSPLCVGLDPFPDRIPALFGDARTDPGAIERFFLEMLALAAPHAACVKPQLGLFEPFGPEGTAIAMRIAAAAQSLGLPVILDAKRGDIGTTAEGYAAASLGPAPGFDADAVTVNPYMGLDTLEPFFAAAQARGKGVAVLVRTSNPGARDLQDLLIEGRPVYAHVAELLVPAQQRLIAACGWSNLLAVVGATAPHEARQLRAILPTALFLVPGYGAQGATAKEAMAGLPRGAGGVVNASRAALYPAAAADARSLPAWRAEISAAIAGLAQELRVAGMDA